MIPQEVPDHDVDHGWRWPAEESSYELGNIGLLGEVRTNLNWPSADREDVARFRQELEERDRRRLPFGFRAPAVAA